MSTRSSIVYAEDFHFFQDLFDEDHSVYLELRGEDISYSASPKNVTIRIPAHVWERIRSSHKTDLSLVNLSEPEIERKVRTMVEERLADIASSDVRTLELAKFRGSGVIGHGDEPTEEQVRKGVAHYLEARAMQRAIVDKVVKPISDEPSADDASEGDDARSNP